MARAHAGRAALALLQRLEDGEDRAVDDLAGQLGMKRALVSKAACRLIQRGLIARCDHARGWYRATRAGLDALTTGTPIYDVPPTPAARLARQAGTFRARAWSAMRMRGQFTIGDIVVDASLTGEGTARERESAAAYIARLVDAGYVAEQRRRIAGTAPTSNGFKLFRLRRDTGPQPPAYSAKNNTIHDRNTGEQVPCAPR